MILDDYTKLTIDKVRGEIAADVAYIHKVNFLLFAGPPAIAGVALGVTSAASLSTTLEIYRLLILATIPVLVIALSLSLRSQSGYIRRRAVWLRYVEDRLGLGVGAELMGWETYCQTSKVLLNSEADGHVAAATAILRVLLARPSLREALAGEARALAEVQGVAELKQLDALRVRVKSVAGTLAGDERREMRRGLRGIDRELRRARLLAATEYYAGARDFVIDLYYGLSVVAICLIVHQRFDTFTTVFDMALYLPWSAVVLEAFLLLRLWYRRRANRIADIIAMTENASVHAGLVAVR